MQKAIAPLEEKEIIQLIIFLAGHEEFGVPIDAVREIIKMAQITPIPTAPDFIRGIINVRGEIVTTIDIKSRFSLPAGELFEPKHIVVTKQEDDLFGLIVDEVVEVLRISRGEIKPPPSVITTIHKQYIKGVITHNERLIILLDLGQILSQDELKKFAQIVKQKNDEAGIQQVLQEDGELLPTLKLKEKSQRKKSPHPK